DRPHAANVPGDGGCGGDLRQRDGRAGDAVMTATAPHLSEFEINMLFERLMHIDGKAEIVDGRIILMSPTGAWPSLVSSLIVMSLERWSLRKRNQFAVPDNCTFRVDLPNRQSFSPDAAYFIGP